jgi:hypothetical protein
LHDDDNSTVYTMKDRVQRREVKISFSFFSIFTREVLSFFNIKIYYCIFKPKPIIKIL